MGIKKDEEEEEVPHEPQRNGSVRKSKSQWMCLIFLECRDLIFRCLRIDPSQRIDLDEILKHPFMVESCPVNMEDESSINSQRIAVSAPTVTGFSQV